MCGTTDGCEDEHESIGFAYCTIHADFRGEDTDFVGGQLWQKTGTVEEGDVARTEVGTIFGGFTVESDGGEVFRYESDVFELRSVIGLNGEEYDEEEK